MRFLPLVVSVLVVSSACKKSIEKHAVSKLEFKAFSVAVPAGWQEVDNPDMKAKAGPNGHILIKDKTSGDYPANVLIQDLGAPSPDTEQIQHATVEMCTTIQQGLVAQTKAQPGKVGLAAFGSMHGCDVEIIDPNSPQATRQLSLSDGKILASIVCNRDKGHPAEADAACEALAAAVTPK